jgi:ABC-2 type transport system ATP-binding protein
MSSGGTSSPVLDVRGLRYSYKNRPALFGATFTVRQGSIHGFVGPNGAGKTTTLKVLATLLKPQGGLVRIFGMDVMRDYKAIRRKTGFMPDHFSMYRQMTVYEYLDFFGAAYGMGPAQRDKIIEDVLTLTDMAQRQDDPIKGLSRGMQQRLSLSRVLVHDPKLLLLDEPASGLDPRGRIELMEVLKELSRMGKTIFISSHILTELTMLCDSITIIDRGRTRYSGSMETLLFEQGDFIQYAVTLREPHPQTEEALRKTKGVTGVTDGDGKATYVVAFNRQILSTNEMLSVVLSSGGEVVSVREHMKHLNQAFLDMTQPGISA